MMDILIHSHKEMKHYREICQVKSNRNTKARISKGDGCLKAWKLVEHLMILKPRVFVPVVLTTLNYVLQ